MRKQLSSPVLEMAVQEVSCSAVVPKASPVAIRRWYPLRVGSLLHTTKGNFDLGERRERSHSNCVAARKKFSVALGVDNVKSVVASLLIILLYLDNVRPGGYCDDDSSELDDLASCLDKSNSLRIAKIMEECLTGGDNCTMPFVFYRIYVGLAQSCLKSFCFERWS